MENKNDAKVYANGDITYEDGKFVLEVISYLKTKFFATLTLFCKEFFINAFHFLVHF